MRGTGHKHLLLLAICLSLTAHGGLVLVASEIGVAVESGPGVRQSQASLPMLLAWADEPTPEPAAEKPQPPALPPQPQPEPEQPLVLGISDSSQDTKNWMGFNEPTPHAAMKSDVEQPGLDPAAGTAAPEGTAGATPDSGSEPTPAGSPSPPVPPTPTLDPAPPAPTKPASEATNQPPARSAEQGPKDTKPADTMAGGEKITEPVQDDLDGPLMSETPESLGEAAESAARAFVGPPFESVKTEPGEEDPQPSARPAPPVPPAPSPNEPGQPTPLASRPTTNSPGDRPGEKSDRESDAASLEEAVEIRFGRPAAAKGLEIVTRRPEFSRVTRLTVYPPNNPRLKVTFNREGRVAQATFLEPTGITEVDSPVLHAVYRWTAKGEALSKLSKDDPKAGVTINVTILLR